ncbi:ATP synthase F1 subunit delta [Ameyamaea chiangmaiensis NBRC 103196]|nr:ATP synthase F1 subunit delta [Ameyamaea chiangmaiensis NBRC 103196]
MNAAAGVPHGMAARYAIALYDLAADRHALDEVLAQVQALQGLIDGSKDLRAFLSDRTIAPTDAAKAMQTILEREGFGELVRNFVGVVAANRRLSRLHAILAAFFAVVSARRGEITADVATAQPLTDVQRIQLRARLADAGYSQVAIHERVDESLLGGLVVSIGARRYDTSLKGRLTRLNNAMKGAA